MTLNINYLELFDVNIQNRTLFGTCFAFYLRSKLISGLNGTGMFSSND